MAWTIEEIERDWLAAPIDALAVDSNGVVAAFEAVEKLLGRPWIEAARVSASGNVIRGTSPTLRVVNMGQKLKALNGAPRADKLIEEVRRGDDSAEAELIAIYLVRSQRGTVDIELFPPVGNRVADFRARDNQGPWTYAEVTQPDWSETTERAKGMLDSIAGLVTGINKSFALEVFLRREPADNELQELLATVPKFCGLDGKQREELPTELGLLLLNESPPGQVMTDDHGEESRPRIGTAKFLGGSAELSRHIAVRMAFSDDRAEAFMTSEARQLPKDAPGLIMMGISRAPGAFKS